MADVAHGMIGPHASGVATSHDLARRQRRRDEREFRVMLVATFLFFLPMALVARLLPRKWRPFASASDPGRSVIGDARAAAYLTVPFALMR